MNDDKRQQDNLDEKTRSEIGKMGGETSSSEQDMSKLGKKGGQAKRDNQSQMNQDDPLMDMDQDI